MIFIPSRSRCGRPMESCCVPSMVLANTVAAAYSIHRTKSLLLQGNGAATRLAAGDRRACTSVLSSQRIVRSPSRGVFARHPSTHRGSRERYFTSCYTHLATNGGMTSLLSGTMTAGRHAWWRHWAVPRLAGAEERAFPPLWPEDRSGRRSSINIRWRSAGAMPTATGCRSRPK